MCTNSYWYKALAEQKPYSFTKISTRTRASASIFAIWRRASAARSDSPMSPLRFAAATSIRAKRGTQDIKLKGRNYRCDLCGHINMISAATSICATTDRQETKLKWRYCRCDLCGHIYTSYNRHARYKAQVKELARYKSRTKRRLKRTHSIRKLQWLQSWCESSKVLRSPARKSMPMRLQTQLGTLSVKNGGAKRRCCLEDRLKTLICRSQQVVPQDPKEVTKNLFETFYIMYQSICRSQGEWVAEKCANRHKQESEY